MKTIVLHNPKRLVEVEIDGTVCRFTTPTLDQKDLFVSMLASGNPIAALRAGRQLVSWCLKEVDANIKYYDENDNIVDFKPKFDDNNYLTTESMEVLSNLPGFDKIRSVVMQLNNAVPEIFWELPPTENNPGKKLAGVKLVKKKAKS